MVRTGRSALTPASRAPTDRSKFRGDIDLDTRLNNSVQKSSFILLIISLSSHRRDDRVGSLERLDKCLMIVVRSRYESHILVFGG